MNFKRDLPPTSEELSDLPQDGTNLSGNLPSKGEATEKIIDLNLASAGSVSSNIGDNSSPAATEFDFKTQSNLSEDFPLSYLRQYYSSDRPVTDDETAVYEFIRQMAGRHLTGAETCLEIGCGPTVHHAIMLAPYVSQITLSDYLDSNLTYVDGWKNRTEKEWDWTRYSAFCIERDGKRASPENIALREELARSKLTPTLPINILRDHPLGHSNQQFDVVSAFYCTEEVALEKSRWQQVMRAVTSLVSKNGYLLMSCLYNTDFYHIDSQTEGVLKLPCAKIDENILRSTLEELNFEITTDSIRLVETPHQENEGVNGVLLVFAQKRIDPNDLS